MAVRLFVYGTELLGEPGHAVLAGAEPCSAETAAGYSIVEVGPVAGLVKEGTGVVHGEIYDLERDALMRVTSQLAYSSYQLQPVVLADGSIAQAFLITADQARGKRRIKGGKWRARFGSGPGGLGAGPLVTWARRRHGS